MRILAAAAFLSALVLAWALAARAAGEASAFLLPSPLDVLRYLEGALKDGTLLEAALVTTKRLTVGYVIGLGLGLPLGMLAGRFQLFDDTLGLLALGLLTLPSVCWVPLALLWFGQSEGALLFVVVMGTVGSIIIATKNGVHSVPPIYVRAARTMGSKRLHMWIFVRIPAALPHLISGMKQGWAFAWRSLMAAEIFVTIVTGFGLGQLLHYGRELNAMDQVIGVMAVILVIGLLADKLLFAPWESFMYRRWGLR